MGITKLHAFAGDAEVMGEVRHFNYDGPNEVLVIHGVKDVGDATAILDRLSLGMMARVSPKEALGIPPEKKPVEPAGATAYPAVAQTPSAAPEVQQMPEPKAGTLREIVADIPRAVAAKPAPELETGGRVEPTGVVLPATVVNAARMRDVVEYFHDVRGMKTLEEIVDACEKVRAEIPLFANAPNLDMRDRVKRTLSAFFSPKA